MIFQNSCNELRRMLKEKVMKHIALLNFLHICSI